MVGALAKVMNGNSRLMGARLGRFASAMLKEGATPEKVLEMYAAPSSWWYRFHWKGKEKGQPPGEKDIRQTWAHWDIPKAHAPSLEDLMSCTR